jgi:hypothetical protein
MKKLKILQGVFQRVVQLHDGRLVSAAIAIVWRREDRHHVPVMHYIT